jgi:hypothetical protein
MKEKIMNFMRHFNLSILAIVLGMACSNASAVSGIGFANVEIKNGVPCFSVADKYFRRSDGKMIFTGLRIYEKRKKKDVIWGYDFSEPIPLLRNSCIFYGVMPEGAEITKYTNGLTLPYDAPVLKMNTLYSVVINAFSLDPKDHIAGHSADFCLQKDKNGDLIVQLVSESCNNVIPPRE